jgi:hypothetical protein
MKKWKGWVIEKQYYKVEVEAETWEEAKDLVGEFNVNWAKPDDYDREIYDVEEIVEENEE